MSKKTSPNIEMKGIRSPLEIKQGIVTKDMVLACADEKIEKSLLSCAYFKRSDKEATHRVEKNKIVNLEEEKKSKKGGETE